MNISNVLSLMAIAISYVHGAGTAMTARQSSMKTVSMDHRVKTLDMAIAREHATKYLNKHKPGYSSLTRLLDSDAIVGGKESPNRITIHTKDGNKYYLPTEKSNELMYWKDKQGKVWNDDGSLRASIEKVSENHWKHFDKDGALTKETFKFVDTDKNSHIYQRLADQKDLSLVSIKGKNAEGGKFRYLENSEQPKMVTEKELHNDPHFKPAVSSKNEVPPNSGNKNTPPAEEKGSGSNKNAQEGSLNNYKGTGMSGAAIAGIAAAFGLSVAAVTALINENRKLHDLRIDENAARSAADAWKSPSEPSENTALLGTGSPQIVSGSQTSADGESPSGMPPTMAGMTPSIPVAATA